MDYHWVIIHEMNFPGTSKEKILIIIILKPSILLTKNDKIPQTIDVFLFFEKMHLRLKKYLFIFSIELLISGGVN